jgi:TolB-like protein/DNA-binding winged helix-turn-helix (wHTH) protein/tetratricopeptide (TPR) repeat protein
MGSWLVQPSLNRLSDADQVVTLEPRLMAVLTCLASRPGKIVSLDEMLDTVWHGRVNVDNTVYQAVAHLRKMLGDDVNHPRYIETVAKKGYRLICPVRPAPEEAEVAEVASGASSQSQHRFKYLAVAAGIASIAVAIILTTSPELRDQPPQPNPESGERSIAILPFVNMSDDPGNEYFSDGLSEDILTLLANIPDLKVIGRTSSFAFKGKNEDLRVIGQSLGVKTVLEGSVRKSGDRVRITAQLIDVSDGTHIWSESYDRTMTDIFSVQDDVAAAIIDALQIHVGTYPTRGRPTENSEAYALFLKARAAQHGFGYLNSTEMLLEAVELDPEFAEAYELLAFTYFRGGAYSIKAAEGQKLTGEAAAKALAIDPDLVLAQALYQSGNIENWSFAREIEAFERAALEQPNNPELLIALSFNLITAGYLQEALSVAERMVDLDPLSSAANMRLFQALYAAGRTSEAISSRELQVKLGNNGARWDLGRINLVARRDVIAISYFEAYGQQIDVPDQTWVREFVARARHPATGQANMDRDIEEYIASVSEEDEYRALLVEMWWYLGFGYLDRYFELILETDLTAPGWWDAEDLILKGTVYRRLGFTAHPKYLEVAKATGIMDVWEQRGPPDFCEKVDGHWVCE